MSDKKVAVYMLCLLSSTLAGLQAVDSRLEDLQCRNLHNTVLYDSGLGRLTSVLKTYRLVALSAFLDGSFVPCFLTCIKLQLPSRRCQSSCCFQRCRKLSQQLCRQVYNNFDTHTGKIHCSLSNPVQTSLIVHRQGSCCRWQMSMIA